MTGTGLMDIITRKEAIERGLTRYFTGEPCKRGHVCERRVPAGNCVICTRQFNNAWAKANPEKRELEYSKWVGTPKGRLKRRKAKAKFKKKNLALMNALEAKRNASKLHATPSWLSKEHKQQIVDIYEQAKLAEQLTGVEHHVDHIEPLQGEDRRGLHVPWNLQILTASENLAKHNRPVQHFHWKKI